MTKEYIEREAVARDVSYLAPGSDYKGRVIDTIRFYPAADVAPVRHGKWVGDNGNQPYDDYKCNHCGYYTETRNRSRLDNYCGNCGARMGGGNK